MNQAKFEEKGNEQVLYVRQGTQGQFEAKKCPYSGNNCGLWCTHCNIGDVDPPKKTVDITCASPLQFHLAQFPLTKDGGATLMEVFENEKAKKNPSSSSSA